MSFKLSEKEKTVVMALQKKRYHDVTAAKQSGLHFAHIISYIYARKKTNADRLLAKNWEEYMQHLMKKAHPLRRHQIAGILQRQGHEKGSLKALDCLVPVKGKRAKPSLPAPGRAPGPGV